MILVDTSVWVEYLRGHQPYLDLLDPLLEDRQILAIEPVFGELLQGVKDDRERRVLLELWGNLPKSPTQGAWVKAGEVSSQDKWLNHGIGLIDAVLIISARDSNAKVWTLDKKMKSVLNKTGKFD